MSWTTPRTWTPLEVPTAAEFNDISGDLSYLYPPIKVQGGQDVYPYYWTGGVVSVSADSSGNFDITFAEAFDHTVVTAWCQSASGGAPFAVTIGSVAADSLSCHASALEGTDVTDVSLSVIYGALGY